MVKEILVTRGRKRRQTKSSNFSRSEMAKPFSWGITKPARKPPTHEVNLRSDTMDQDIPKIAWMPITSVKNADVKTSISVTVITSAVG